MGRGTDSEGEGALRVGIGYDVHRLSEGRALILGGVEIPSSKGPVGHSDGDVVVHAVIDALLGAAALGDIGKHFPDTDARYAGVSSLLLLRDVHRKLQGERYRVMNIDATVVLEQPKLAPHVPAMRANIAGALNIEKGQVSIKATTSEGMGFVGSGEGIAAYAVASLFHSGD